MISGRARARGESRSPNSTGSAATTSDARRGSTDPDGATRRRARPFACPSAAPEGSSRANARSSLRPPSRGTTRGRRRRARPGRADWPASRWPAEADRRTRPPGARRPRGTWRHTVRPARPSPTRPPLAGDERDRLACLPVAIRDGLGPAHADDRLVRMIEASVGPPSGRWPTSGGEKRRILAIGHRGASHREPLGPDPVRRTLARMSLVPAHPEPAGLHHDEVHGVEYNQVLASTTWRDDMNFAERMSRLGTETAFEVLARAQALEAQGKRDRPPRDRRARLRHAGAHPRGGEARAGRRRHALRPVGRAARAARGDREGRRDDARHPGRARTRSSSRRAPSRSCSSRSSRSSTRATRSIYPNPGFPIYESVIHFVGATPVPIPLREEPRLRLRPRRCSSAARSASARSSSILNSPHNPTGGVLDAGPARGASPS